MPRWTFVPGAPDSPGPSAGATEEEAPSDRVADRRVTTRALLAGDDAAVAAALLPIRGIGPWSVDMFLMFGLCRPDIWPVGDYGVRAGVKLFLGLRALPAGDKLIKLARPWQPWRSLAAWYMWRVVEASRAAATS